MSVRNVLTAFLMAVSLAVGGFADEQAVVPDSSSADTIPLSDSATRLPEVDEFVPVDKIAEMIHYEVPTYPSFAESPREGLVWIKALVGTDGAVWDAGIWGSSGNVFFDLAALQEAPKCRFKPAIQNGRTVSMWVTYKVDFFYERKKARSPDKWAFKVESRVDTLVSPLWENLIEVSTFPETGQRPDSTGSALLSDSVGSPESQQFGILILSETDDTLRGKQKALALIDGGCANGLTIGLKGTIWDHLGDKPIKLANVEVQDVQAFESLCLVESLRRRTVTNRHRVAFDQPPLPAAELLSRAEQYYASGLHEQALACYETISGLADSNALVKSRLEEFQQSDGLDAGSTTEADSARLRNRIPGWLKVAEAYIRLGKPMGTRRYIDKILALDNTNEAALELRIALLAYEECKIDMKNLFLGSRDTTGIDKLPRMITAGHAWPRIPPGDYYSEWYPKNKNESESVWVRALVGSKGQILRAEVHRTSGMRELDYAAVEAAFQTKFEPGISCGRPMAMWVKWKVRFWREPS